MPLTQKQQFMIRSLSQLGNVYVSLYLENNRQAYPRRGNHWIDGLGFFLKGYAFERQGTSPAYSKNACEALRNILRDNRRRVPGRVLSRELWREFCLIGGYVGGRGANPKRNPLKPRIGRDVISICSGLVDDSHNIFAFAQGALHSLEDDEVRTAHQQLCRIRGVGPKIASFFLRDVAIDSGLANALIASNIKLQPIDIWIRRIVSSLCNDIDGASDNDFAERVVDLAKDAGESPLLFNAGAWYFGARVARRISDVEKALERRDVMRRTIQEYIDQIRVELAGLEQTHHQIMQD